MFKNDVSVRDLCKIQPFAEHVDPSALELSSGKFDISSPY